MIKIVNNFLNGFIGACIGIFISSSIYKYYDFKTHPDLYMVNSAPWHLSIEIHALFTVIICAITIIIKYIIKRKLKPNKDNNEKTMN